MMDGLFAKNILISVILPVWNPGPGIDRCIESLRSQTLKDIEMIFVDDRGTDDAMEKVRAAAAEDPRICILENPENLGAGPSRNRGIEAARGEYILCVDPDDFIDPHFLEALYQYAAEKNLDIVKGSIVLDIPELGISKKSKMNQEIQDKLAMGYPLYMVFSKEHTSLLVRRELILEQGIKYSDTRYSQDMYYLFLLGLSNASFGICDAPESYHVVYRKDSKTRTFSDARLFDRLKVFQDSVELLLKREHDIYAKKFIITRVHYLLRLHAYIRRFPGQKESAKLFLKELREQLNRCPLVDNDVKEDLVLRGLVKYGENIVKRPFASPFDKPGFSDYLDVYLRLLAFAVRHPNEIPSLTKGFLKSVYRKIHHFSRNATVLRKH